MRTRIASACATGGFVIVILSEAKDLSFSMRRDVER